MATTFIDYTGDGNATKSFSFPSIQQSDVKVSVNGTIFSSGTHYIISNYTTTGGGNVVFQAPHIPNSPAAIRIFRDTDVDNAKATYTAGSSVKAADLNANHEQLLFAAQEEQNQTVTSDKIKDSSIITAKIADDAVTMAKLGSGALPTDITVARANIVAGAVNDSILDSNAVTTAKINNLAVTGAKIANTTIAGTKLVNGAVDTDQLATNAVSTVKIQNGAVTDAKLAPNAVTNSIIVNNAVTTNKILDNAVTTDKIPDVNVTRAKLANDAVNEDKLADLAVRTEHLAGGAVTNAKIADGTIETAKFVTGSVSGSVLANGAVTEPKITDGNVTTPKLADAELRTLANMQSGTASILASSTALTATTAELNQLDGITLETSVTTNSDTRIPTSKAVNDLVLSVTNALGGFVAIANETSFPTANPDPSNNAGTVVSISQLASGLAVNSSGVATITNGAGTGNTVTITGFPSSLHSQTLPASSGLQVQTTSTLHTYTFHKQLASAADIQAISATVNSFSNRYRVSASAPTSSLDGGDLWYDTTNSKLMVYSSSNSAWEESSAIGNFFISTISSSSNTGGGSATPNGTAYRFTISNAPTTAAACIVSVDGVIQKPNSGSSQPSEGFVLVGNDIIFGAAPANGASLFVTVIGSTVGIGTPSDNTVTTAILQNASVTTAKIADGSVTNAKVSGSAAIAGTKISPDFGSQNILTSGGITADDITIERPTGNLSANFKATNGLGTLEIGGSTGAFIDLKTPFTDDFDFRVDNDGTLTSVGNIVLTVNSNETGLRAMANGAVELYHDGTKKLDTTSTGISVSGTVASDGLAVGDNEKATFGAAQDLEIYHDGSHSFLKNSTGYLRLAAGGSGVTINNADNSETMATFVKDGSVELYHDNIKKFETTSGGVNVTGALTVNGSAINTDLVSDTTPQLGGNLASNGNNILMADGDDVRFGSSDDLQISHNGTNSVLDNHTGHLMTMIPASRGFRVQKQGGQEDVLNAYTDGAVELFHNGTKKLNTTSSGVEVDGNVQFPDGGEVKLGADGDLRMFHSGSQNYIQSYNDKTFRIQSFGTSADIKLQTNESENNIICKPNGATELYYDNGKKLETTSTGIKVYADIQQVWEGGTATHWWKSEDLSNANSTISWSAQKGGSGAQLVTSRGGTNGMTYRASDSNFNNHKSVGMSSSGQGGLRTYTDNVEDTYWNGSEAFTMMIVFMMDGYSGGTSYANDALWVHSRNNAGSDDNTGGWGLSPFGDHTWGGGYGESFNYNTSSIPDFGDYPLKGIHMVRMEANFDYLELSSNFGSSWDVTEIQHSGPSSLPTDFKNLCFLNFMGNNSSHNFIGRIAEIAYWKGTRLWGAELESITKYFNNKFKL